MIQRKNVVNRMKHASILIFFVTYLSAQNISLTGTVTDTSGLTPLAGAAVWLRNQNLSDTTGENGSFILTNINTVERRRNNPAQNNLSGTVRGRVLTLTIPRESRMEISTWSLHGKKISAIRKYMKEGTHSVMLPSLSPGVYIHKIKSGYGEMVIRSCFGSGNSGINQSDIQNLGFTAVADFPDTLDDILEVRLEGYLDYSVIATVPRRENMEIKLIECAGTVTDEEGNVYQTVKIGDQIWTTSNYLATKGLTYVQDDSSWREAGKNRIPAYCYYRDRDSSLIKTYGPLFNWWAAVSIDIEGWRVPTEADWKTLENFLIQNGYNYDGTTTFNRIAKSIAAKVDWPAATSSGSIGNDLTLNNRSGFAALPGGFRHEASTFSQIRGFGCWWSSTEHDRYPTFASQRRASFMLHFIDDGYLDKGFGFSVRLVRDINK